MWVERRAEQPRRTRGRRPSPTSLKPPNRMEATSVALEVPTESGSALQQKGRPASEARPASLSSTLSICPLYSRNCSSFRRRRWRLAQHGWPPKPAATMAPTGLCLRGREWGTASAFDRAACPRTGKLLGGAHGNTPRPKLRRFRAQFLRKCVGGRHAGLPET